MKLPCKFQLGARVYHRCDSDAGRGMITKIIFFANGCVVYSVCWSVSQEANHYEAELTTVKEFDFGGGDDENPGPPEQETAEKL